MFSDGAALLHIAALLYIAVAAIVYDCCSGLPATHALPYMRIYAETHHVYVVPYIYELSCSAYYNMCPHTTHRRRIGRIAAFFFPGGGGLLLANVRGCCLLMCAAAAAKFV